MLASSGEEKEQNEPRQKLMPNKRQFTTKDHFLSTYSSINTGKVINRKKTAPFFDKIAKFVSHFAFRLFFVSVLQKKEGRYIFHPFPRASCNLFFLFLSLSLSVSAAKRHNNDVFVRRWKKERERERERERTSRLNLAPPIHLSMPKTRLAKRGGGQRSWYCDDHEQS